MKLFVPPPPALAAVSLRAGHRRRPADQDLGGRPLRPPHQDLVGGHIPMGGAIPVVPHVLRITPLAQRRRGLFALCRLRLAHTVRWCLSAFSLLAALVVLIVLVRLGDRFTLTTVALALVFAGALGNVHDRILYGSVVDFIEVHIFGYHWPDFNVADSSIVTGACLLMLDSLRPQKRDRGAGSGD